MLTITNHCCIFIVSAVVIPESGILTAGQLLFRTKADHIIKIYLTCSDLKQQGRDKNCLQTGERKDGLTHMQNQRMAITTICT